jgi:hypothetical protein
MSVIHGYKREINESHAKCYAKEHYKTAFFLRRDLFATLTATDIRNAMMSV